MAKDIQNIINDPISPEDYSFEDDKINLQNSEIDPIGDIALDELDDELEFNDDLNNELNDDEFDAELNSSDIPEEETEFTPPEEQIKWTVIPQENKKIRSEHINGFILQAHPLSSKQGDKIKYVAQLSKDGKMINKGVIWINKNKDVHEFLQNIADRILDRLNLMNISVKEEPEEEKEPDLNELDELDELDELEPEI